MDADLAQVLLEIKAITFSVDVSYPYASGLSGPIYCDNRIALSHVYAREQVLDAYLQTIDKNSLDHEVVAGVATGGIPWGTLVADRLQKPFVYVRKPKLHGKKNSIEGYLPRNATVLIIEDTLNSGASSREAVEFLQSAGASIAGLVAILSYETTAEKVMRQQYQTHSLTNLSTVIEQAIKGHYICGSEIAAVQNWRANPAQWH
jgi:orotate phosphoribosyltransferase